MKLFCTGTGQHGGRREYLWSDEATEKLVMMVKENYAKVIGGRDAREEVFREITKKLVEYVSVVGVDTCSLLCFPL